MYLHYLEKQEPRKLGLFSHVLCALAYYIFDTYQPMLIILCRL